MPPFHFFKSLSEKNFFFFIFLNWIWKSTSLLISFRKQQQMLLIWVVHVILSSITLQLQTKEVRFSRKSVEYYFWLSKGSSKLNLFICTSFQIFSFSIFSILSLGFWGERTTFSNCLMKHTASVFKRQKGQELVPHPLKFFFLWVSVL